MQPYLFPYMGYYQLIRAVDRFVLLDDAAYINKGWINRNRILLNGQAHLFTVPLQNASQNVRIRDLEVAVDDRWRGKFFRTLKHAYGHAPGYDRCNAMIEKVFIDWLRVALRETTIMLGMDTCIVEQAPPNELGLGGQNRIIDICQREGASVYFNPISGRSLYEANAFREAGVQLNFLESVDSEYHQFGAAYVSGLSIIDVLMFNDVESAHAMLTKYRIVEGS